MHWAPESIPHRQPTRVALGVLLLALACPTLASGAEVSVCRVGKVEMIVGGAEVSPSTACTSGATPAEATNPAPGARGALRVDDVTQSGRDAERRRILLIELRRQEQELGLLQSRHAADPQAMNRTRENIAALHRELARGPATR